MKKALSNLKNRVSLVSRKALLAGTVVLAAGGTVMAADPPAEITAANGIVDTATATFGSVATLAVSIAAFVIILRIVKKLAK